MLELNHFNKSLTNTQIMKIHRNIYLMKYQKLTTNYCHLLKDELFVCMCGENCVQDTNILSTPAL